MNQSANDARPSVLTTDTCSLNFGSDNARGYKLVIGSEDVVSCRIKMLQVRSREGLSFFLFFFSFLFTD